MSPIRHATRRATNHAVCMRRCYAHVRLRGKVVIAGRDPLAAATLAPLFNRIGGLMRSLLSSLALCLIALPVTAQQQPAPPTTAALAEGWQGRVDRANQNITEVKFMKMGNG